MPWLFDLYRTQPSQPLTSTSFSTHSLGLSTQGSMLRPHPAPSPQAPLTRAPQPLSVLAAVLSLQSAPQRSLHRACHQGLHPWPTPRPRHRLPAATGCACCLLPHNERRNREKRRNIWFLVKEQDELVHSTCSIVITQLNRATVASVQIQDIPLHHPL